MPQRGRDTIALETMIGLSTISIGLLCLTYFAGSGEIEGIVSLMRRLAPIELWSAAWISVGSALLYGCSTRNRVVIEYASLMTAGLWAVLTYHAIPFFRLYTLTCALAPIFTIFSGSIYFYHSRIAAKARNGRSPQTIRE
jgi:hypothetical protein